MSRPLKEAVKQEEVNGNTTEVPKFTDESYSYHKIQENSVNDRNQVQSVLKYHILRFKYNLKDLKDKAVFPASVELVETKQDEFNAQDVVEGLNRKVNHR